MKKLIIMSSILVSLTSSSFADTIGDDGPRVGLETPDQVRGNCTIDQNSINYGDHIVTDYARSAIKSIKKEFKKKGYSFSNSQTDSDLELGLDYAIYRIAKAGGAPDDFILRGEASVQLISQEGGTLKRELTKNKSFLSTDKGLIGDLFVKTIRSLPNCD